MFHPQEHENGLPKVSPAMPADQPGDKPAASQSESREHAQLAQDVSTLSVLAERLRIHEYVELLQRPWRLIWLYFLTGLARGAGVAIGGIIIVALITYLLSSMVSAPMLGKSVAGLVKEIQRHLPSK